MSDGMFKDILHRVETLEELARSTSGSKLSVSLGSVREEWKEDNRPTLRNCDFPVQMNQMTEVHGEHDSLLLEKEVQNTHLAEQVRMLTDELEELRSTLRRREMDYVMKYDTKENGPRESRPER